jgi:hypothetical protein
MIKQIMSVHDLLDGANVDGYKVLKFFEPFLSDSDSMTIERIEKDGKNVDFLKIQISGSDPKAPTLGIVGQLGGIGARPDIVGMVSDADGAIVALASALKLLEMKNNGSDRIKGNVIITTHICPNSPTIPHKPVPFMNSLVGIHATLKHLITPEMNAVLSIDATKGNRIINVKGFAFTPTVKEGYILKVSEDLLTIYERVTGRKAVILPITTQDITPYENGIFHINSIMQPAVWTNAPVVGVATTSETAIAGCATGANSEIDLEAVGRFCVEVAKDYTNGKCAFYDKSEFKKLVNIYGSMEIISKIKDITH